MNVVKTNEDDELQEQLSEQTETVKDGRTNQDENQGSEGEGKYLCYGI